MDDDDRSEAMADYRASRAEDRAARLPKGVECGWCQESIDPHGKWEKDRTTGEYYCGREARCTVEVSGCGTDDTEDFHADLGTTDTD